MTRPTVERLPKLPHTKFAAIFFEMPLRGFMHVLLFLSRHHHPRLFRRLVLSLCLVHHTHPAHAEFFENAAYGACRYPPQEFNPGLRTEPADRKSIARCRPGNPTNQKAEIAKLPRQPVGAANFCTRSSNLSQWPLDLHPLAGWK